MRHIYHCIGHKLVIPDITGSDGIYVIDSKGMRYMDLESGVWCMSVGHRNRWVFDAMIRQFDVLVQSGFCYTNPIVESAAEDVLKITGLAEGKCVFLCSGSEAIEVSRQIAGFLSGHDISMTLHDSYLGAYSSVKNRKSGWHQFDWSRCRDCSNHVCADCELMKHIPKNISAFIFEPGSASGFVRFPPKNMIRTICDIVRSNGGKVIVNEVTTGVGRTGKWFGYQHYDLKPDMVAVGKGIGNGYPVSVAAISRETIDELEGTSFVYSQSHQNDPLGASVVKAVIDYIEEYGLIDNAAEIGEWLGAELQRCVDGAVVTAVRGRGLMYAMDLSDADMTDRIYHDLIRRGFIVGNRRTALRIDPPLTVTKDELSSFLEAFGESVAACG